MAAAPQSGNLTSASSKHLLFTMLRDETTVRYHLGINPKQEYEVLFVLS